MPRMASSTRSRSFGRTAAVSLMTCETVPMDTLARSAICRIVTGGFMRRYDRLTDRPRRNCKKHFQLTCFETNRFRLSIPRLERSENPEPLNGPCLGPSLRACHARPAYRLVENTIWIPGAGNNCRPAKCLLACAHPEILRSTATRFLPSPSPRTGLHREGARRPHPDPAWFVLSPPLEQH